MIKGGGYGSRGGKFCGFAPDLPEAPPEVRRRFAGGLPEARMLNPCPLSKQLPPEAPTGG